MSIITLLFIAGFLIVIGAYAAIFALTECNRTRVAKPSRWQYGSGARHGRQNLPPISHAATSAPMGSADASAWPSSNAVPNRNADH